MSVMSCKASVSNNEVKMRTYCDLATILPKGASVVDDNCNLWEKMSLCINTMQSSTSWSPLPWCPLTALSKASLSAVDRSRDWTSTARPGRTSLTISLVTWERVLFQLYLIFLPSPPDHLYSWLKEARLTQRPPPCLWMKKYNMLEKWLRERWRYCWFRDHDEEIVDSKLKK